MQALEGIDNRRLADFKDGKEIVRGGFQQYLVSQSIKAFGFEHGGVAFAAAVLATRLHVLHDALPSALRKGRIAGGEVGAGKMQV